MAGPTVTDMPVSRKRKQRRPAKGTPGRPLPPGRVRYTPTTLSDSTEDTFHRLASLPPHLLPSVGLGEWYLASSPMRTGNQCVVASLTVMQAMRAFGLDAEPVALILDIENAYGVTQRYGSESPHLDGDRVVGHVGLVADDLFMDVTASQFPEVMAHGGQRVLSGALNGQADAVLNRGALVPTRLADGFQATYRVAPLGSADGLMLPILERSRDEAVAMVHNLLTGYTAAMSSEPFLSQVQSITTPRHQQFVEAVLQMRGAEVRMGDDGLMMVRRSPA